jgi:hypothetical protein
MAIATTYNTAGDREDLTNALTILTPEDCPKLSTFPKSTAAFNMLHEWQMDTLLPVSFPGVVEGADVSSFTDQVAQRARTGNRQQLFTRTWAVSRSQLASDPAGVSNEMANSKTKAMREMKRDQEACIGSDNDLQVGTGLVPSKLRALGKYISTSPGSDIPSIYTTPSASISTATSGALTESGFNDVYQSIFQQVGGRRSYSQYTGPTLKRTISKFQRNGSGTTATQVYLVNQDATQHQIDLNVTIYHGDFHDVTIIPDMFNGLADGANPGVVTAQQQNRGYVIDPELVGIAYMYGVESQDLPDFGGGPNGYLRCSLTLEVKNPLGLGKFAGAS